MPAVIALRVRPADPSAVPARFEPATRHLHGLACTLFEGAGAGHADQGKATSHSAR